VVGLDGASAIGVLRNTGDLAFATELEASATAQVHEVAIGDVDGDGLPDLVGLTSTGVDVLLQNTDHTFAAPLSFPAGTSPQHLLLVDLDGDHVMEIATLDPAAEHAHRPRAERVRAVTRAIGLRAPRAPRGGGACRVPDVTFTTGRRAAG